MTTSTMRTDRLVALASSILFPTVSVGVAGTFVVANDGFGRGDLGPFGFWSALPLMILYPAVRRLDQRLQAWNTIVGYFAAIIFAVLFAYFWTSVVALILGGWIGAFSFPVLFCWLVGSLIALTCPLMIRRPSSWPVAVGLLPTLCIAIFLLFRWMSTPLPDLIVYLKPGISNHEINYVWENVLSTRSNRGSLPLEGISSLSAWDTESRKGVRVGFWPGTSEKRRDEIRQITLASPLVDNVVDGAARSPTALGAIHKFEGVSETQLETSNSGSAANQTLERIGK